MDIRALGVALQRPSYATAQTASAEPASRDTTRVVAVDTPAAVSPAEAATNLAELKSAVETINKSLKEQSQSIQFSVEDGEQVVVKVVDQETKEVVRQIPSKETLEIARAIESALQGLLIRQKA